MIEEIFTTLSPLSCQLRLADPDRLSPQGEIRSTGIRHLATVLLVSAHFILSGGATWA
jgi:hypothetical protein